MVTTQSYFFIGIALLDSGTDLNEARSFTYENEIVDIYSNSWGVYDDGYSIGGPEHLAKMALQNGINEVCMYVYKCTYSTCIIELCVIESVESI